MKRRKKSEDEWTFHINDWLDNGTFRQEDEFMEEEMPETKDEMPVQKPASSNNFKTTGRFDQFNDEFDANFDSHSHDAIAERDDESPDRTARDEYTDEDPYKIRKEK